MSCVLRASGQDFDVDAYLTESPFEPDTVFRRGERVAAEAAEGPARGAGGFNLTVSRAPADDLAAQIDEATRFLDLHEEELRRLTGFAGVDVVFLNFGVSWRNVPVHTDVFPADLLWRAGALDISLAVSHYPSAGH
jgi:hypothetical protein